MEASEATMWRIYSETLARLEMLSRRVAEGRNVDEASSFARWLAFSGIIILCKANAQPSPLKCDGAFLEFQCKELVSACNEIYRTNGRAANIGASEIETLHEKVNRLLANQDLIAGHVSRLAPVTSSKALEPSATFSTTADDGRGGGAAALVPSPLSPLPCPSVTTRTGRSKSNESEEINYEQKS